jgi:hypothetical protein
MRTRAAWLVLTALLLGGCAAEPAATPTRSGTPGDTPAEPARTDMARMVRVVVSGGIAGVTETYEVSRTDPPEGVSRARAERVLTLADSPAVQRLDGRRPPLRAQCCDLRSFEVVVRHGDGSRTRVTLTESMPMPPQLTRLVGLLSRSG